MDCQAVALRVLAHFSPGPDVLNFLAPEAVWTEFYRELPACWDGLSWQA
jgi:hypothetical protein